MKCADCGKAIPKTPTGHVGGTGYALFGETREIVCYPCANTREREAMKAADVYGVYVSSDGQSLTTWTGGVLAFVTRETRIRGAGFHRSDIWTYRAKAPDGSQWYGRGAGRGMCLTIRRSKAGTARKVA